MYSFKNDYAEGAHPSILNALMTTNSEQQNGYGEDRFSFEAKSVIRELIGVPSASIYFLAGGTLANLLVISYLLRPHEAVISAVSGHIQANETGAIEQTGHRIITVPGVQGKVTSREIHEVMEKHTLRPHVVKPRMVYISNATEWGTIYTRTELIDLYAVCQAFGLFLFMDGARLGHALASRDNELSWNDIAEYTDVFYIGGTKNGALLGEAIVFKDPDLSNDFDYQLKQRGALLAKGRLLGIQFLTLIGEDLYLDLARHANQQAERIAKAFTQLGIKFHVPPQTNQLFPVVPNRWIERLSNQFAFYVWSAVDKHYSVVRMITSWATTDEAVESFIQAMDEYE
jgi:threonine aldolase